jgi:proteic killer suppression protein
VIRSFADDTTEDVWFGLDTKPARRIPKALWRTIRRKLAVVDAATKPIDVAVTPGYRLEALKGDRAGRYSIRVNDQYRITFRFEHQDARDVLCEDYHRG